MFRVLELSSWLTPDDGVEIDISPGAFGNNSLGYNDGATYHTWQPLTFPTVPGLLLNPRGNLHLACQAVIDGLAQ